MRLSDILSSGGGNGDGDIGDIWNNTEAAGEFEPLPPGEYVARIADGELKQSRSNSTPGYCLTFEVLEPVEFAKRRFWLDCWLTPGAMPVTKRDLAKLGVVELTQLEQPLPRWIVCRCKVSRRKDDDGNVTNRVKSFVVVRIDPPESDPFAPTTIDDAASAGGTDNAGDGIDTDAGGESEATNADDDAKPTDLGSAEPGDGIPF